MDVRPVLLERVLQQVDHGPFDAHARRLAQRLRSPIGLVTVLDDHDQRFAGMHGLDGTGPGAARGTPLASSLCRCVADEGRALVLRDGRRDRRLRTHPAITGLGLRAYLGVPLHLPDGSRIGAVCVADVRPRRWTPHDVATATHVRDEVEQLLSAPGHDAD